MCAAVQSLTDVAGQGSDVRPLAADDTNRGLHRLGVETLELYLVNDQHLRLELHLFSLAGEVVGTVSVHLACREGRRHLLNATEEACQRLAQQRLGDVLRGVCRIDGLFEVEARSRGAELQRGDVFLDVCLQFFDTLRRLACADNHHACCQRVERAGMPHLELLYAEPFGQLPTYLAHHVEACPPQRFVEAKYLSFYEVHQSTITSECPDHSRARMTMPTMMR